MSFKNKWFLYLAFTVVPAWPLMSSENYTIYPAPAGAPLSGDYFVKVNGESIDLYDAGYTRWGSTSTFGYFDISGEVEVEVAAVYPPPHSTVWQVLPAKYGVKPERVKNGQIRFTINHPMKLTFVVMGDYQGRVLHLFANAPIENPPSADDPDVLYYGPGYHDIGEANDWTIRLGDNQMVYLADGAFVRGFILADSVKNIRIAGHGVLMQDRDMPRKRGITLEDCEGIDISGIVCNRNRDGWAGVIINCNDIRIHDYKVVAPAIWSSDGMNLVNCQNAVYRDCFFRAGDDNIAIKGIAPRRGKRSEWAHYNPDKMPANENILVEDCIFWSDNNNAVVLGQETHAAHYRNIIFRDCDVLFVRDDEPIKAVLAIVCLHATDYRDILFENIRVGPSGQLITVYYTEEVFGIPGDQSWPGEINGVVFRDIDAHGAGSKLIRIKGCSEEKKIRNILLDNVRIDGKKVTESSRFLQVNEFVEGLELK